MDNSPASDPTRLTTDSMKADLAGAGGGAGDTSGGWFAMLQNLSMEHHQDHHHSHPHHDNSSQESHSQLSDSSTGTPATSTSVHDLSTGVTSVPPADSTASSKDSPSADGPSRFDADSHRQALDARLETLARHALVPESTQTAAFDAQGRHDSESSFESDISDIADDAENISLSDNDRMTEEAKKKMEQLEKEFGVLPDLPVPEMYTSESQSAIITNVMVGGRVFLTNARLAYWAILPDLEEEVSKASSHVPHKGVTVRTLIPGYKDVRLWGVLTPESMAVYKSNKDLYKPLATISYVNVLQVLPADNEPQSLKIKVRKRMPKGPPKVMAIPLILDSEEATIDLRNQLSELIFKYHNTRDRFRASIPLVRIVRAEVEAYIFGTDTLHLWIDVDEPEVKELKLAICGVGATVEEEGLQEPFVDSFYRNWKDAKTQRSLLPSAEQAKQLPKAIIDIFVGPEQEEGEGGRLRDEDWMRRAESFNWTLEEEEGEGVDDDEDKKTKRKKLLAAAFQVADGEIKTVYRADLNRLIPTYGMFGIGHKAVYFYGKKSRSDIRLLIPLSDIKGVITSKCLRVGWYAFELSIKAHENVKIEIRSKAKRDLAFSDVQKALKQHEPPVLHRSGSIQSRHEEGIREASAKEESRKEMDHWLSRGFRAPLKDIPTQVLATLPRLVNPVKGWDKNKAAKSLKFYCMTIGSRGDVQPYIALCQRLMEHGHDCTIVSHPEYRSWVESFGIHYKEAGGDPGVLMEVSVEHKIFSAETVHKFRKWLDDLMDEAYTACKEADVLIESPSTMAGIHVAEALHIPYIRAFTMPWTRTGDFPHAFLSGPTEMSRAWNYSSYVIFEQVFWRAAASQINRFRKKIGLHSTDLEKMRQRQIPFVYNFSTAVVPRPLDWSDTICVSGYWYLSTPPKSWDPPEALVAFLKKAREDKKPLVYIGFGSITVKDPNAMTAAIVEAVKKSDCRAVLSKGWSARMAKGKQGNATDEVKIPPSIYQVDSIPHDWLFPQIDAAMHHGGAGTTAASLKAGLTTLIKPFFGDQYFWASRVHHLGAGVRVHSLSAADLTDALNKTVRNTMMREKAQVVAEQLNREDGVGEAVNFIYRLLDRAAVQRGGTASGVTQSLSKLSSTPSPIPTPPISRTNTQNTSPKSNGIFGRSKTENLPIMPLWG